MGTRLPGRRGQPCESAARQSVSGTSVTDVSASRVQWSCIYSRRANKVIAPLSYFIQNVPVVFFYGRKGVLSKRYTASNTRIVFYLLSDWRHISKSFVAASWTKWPLGYICMAVKGLYMYTRVHVCTCRLCWSSGIAFHCGHFSREFIISWYMLLIFILHIIRMVAVYFYQVLLC